jgi:hypothetical protein
VQAVNDAADPNFRIGENNALIYRGGSIGRMTPPMLDWDLRIKDMDAAKASLYETARAIVESSPPAGLTREQKRYATAKRFYGDELPERALVAYAKYTPGV